MRLPRGGPDDRRSGCGHRIVVAVSSSASSCCWVETTASAGAAGDGAGYVCPDLAYLDGLVRDEKMAKDVLADLGRNAEEAVSRESAADVLSLLLGVGLGLGRAASWVGAQDGESFLRPSDGHSCS